MLPTALLSLLLASPGASAKGPAARTEGGLPPEVLRETQAAAGELQRLKDELEPAVSRLEELAPRYESGESLRRLERERGPLREDVLRPGVALDRRYDDFKRLCDGIQLRMGVAVMSDVLKRRETELSVNALSKYQECSVLRGKIHSARERAWRALEAEDKLHQAAVEAASVRRRRAVTAAALAVLLACGGHIALRLRRAQRERVHYPEIVG